eukprot:TRINITY_DN5648_c0_g1_i2.p1 TRINITY_DN5648_c0_g1~~TRINITY_DN5648_c0_g1_i2.p1  ORF type:complete len:345 (+),score=109.69 TRINITY_DN5648_c0_g1_i2:31-1035(+)
MAPKAKRGAAASKAAAAAGPKKKTKAEAKKPAAKAAAKKGAKSATDKSDDVPPASGEEVAELVASLNEGAWREALKGEFEKPYFKEIARFVAEERKNHPVHPPAERVFEALNVTPLEEVRAVILGQDPYHEPGQAHGLCFSVLPGIKTPPSLVNMYKELQEDIPGFTAPSHGYLLDWAKQGVLMLNATLTVRQGSSNANSHAKCGWQQFTDEIIKVLNDRSEGVVFLLWGNFAQKKGKIVDRERHTVLESGHPSPLSVKKWRGCKTFSKCNAALRARGKPEIDWKFGPLEKAGGGDAGPAAATKPAEAADAKPKPDLKAMLGIKVNGKAIDTKP